MEAQGKGNLNTKTTGHHNPGALDKRGPTHGNVDYVASYSIRGVHVAYPTKPWQRQHKEFLKEFQQRERGIPELFEE